MPPTLMAAAGVPDVKEQLLKGMKVGSFSLDQVMESLSKGAGGK